MRTRERRYSRWLTVGLPVLVALLIAAGASLTLFMSRTAAGPCDHARTAAITVGTASGDVLESGDSAQLDAYLGAQTKLGLCHLRTDDPWDTVQRTATSQLDWSKPVLINQRAAAHGVTVTAILDGDPAWNTHDASSQAAYVAYCTSFGRTFGPGGNVTEAEIKNEPNSIAYYGSDPTRYVRDFLACQTAIHRYAPHIRVIPGGTAAVGISSHTQLSAPDWYRALCHDGLAGHLEGAALHPYTWDSSPASATPGDSGNPWSQIAIVQGILSQDCHYDGPIQLTEMGAPTGGGKIAPTNARLPSFVPGQPVSESEQALEFTDTFHAIQVLGQQGVRIDELDVYSLIDQGDPSGTEGHFGIYNSINGGEDQFTPGLAKPATSVIRAFAQAQFAQPN